MLENTYIRLRRGETQQNFTIWVYRERDLTSGIRLFIGQEGIATNDNFMTPTYVGSFDFSAGDYRLEVFGKVVGRDQVFSLAVIDLKIDQREAKKLRERDAGIYFDWGPDAERYQTKIDSKRFSKNDPLKMLEMLRQGGPVDIPEKKDTLDR